MPHVALPGVRLWYEDSEGSGVPVVFLHPASGTSESWAHQVPAFTKAGYRCASFDRRGWGRSEPDPARGPATASAFSVEHAVPGTGFPRWHTA